MGQQLSTMFSGMGRFFEYPVKRKPICFYRQEDFSATGEAHRKISEMSRSGQTDYDKLVDLFYTRLAEQRQFNQEMKEKDRRWSMQKVVERFPGWNEVTIANLHSLFLLFDNQSNGMLGFDDFGAVMESLGDESPMELRKEKFNAADTDNDGWITYDEFLSLVYNFNPSEDDRVGGLAALCNDVAENIQFVSNLTVGEQLEYGLF
ncbi:troponin C-like [Trichoplusia ni]|uniref:Troponin C-like n=1 Tax=Trichoplusia ni TaxID=7111 RepID=A0A7E5WJQ4_TRINI|nr:troponin C-like [Trichoplusia ni]